LRRSSARRNEDATRRSSDPERRSSRVIPLVALTLAAERSVTSEERRSETLKVSTSSDEGTSG